MLGTVAPQWLDSSRRPRHSRARKINLDLEEERNEDLWILSEARSEPVEHEIPPVIAGGFRDGKDVASAE
jgi:hypothetical protein